MAKIIYDRRALHNLMVACIEDSIRLAFCDAQEEKEYYRARHEAYWLETEGRRWMDIIDFSLNRPSFWIKLNHYQGLLALREALKTFEVPTSENNPLLVQGELEL